LDESFNSLNKPDQGELRFNEMWKISVNDYEGEKVYEEYDDEEVCVPLQFEAF